MRIACTFMYFAETTLLLTDIQDSTTLWEVLPVEVMDAALKIHHNTIRKEILAHQGYESGTVSGS
jgi:class 3 adenylate cyclase